MSWNVSVPAGPLSEVEERARKVKEVAAMQFQIEEANTAFEAALAAVPALAAAIGADADDEVAVTLAGHANERNVPRQGWSPDTVYVSVGTVQKTAAEPQNHTTPV